ncbi:MAG: hypothetical protein IMW89_02320 [Ktedonobacteraceae bacterium]|nr:hypothetical protein [Ktedonobacteraceae bacterium]
MSDLWTSLNNPDDQQQTTTTPPARAARTRSAAASERAIISSLREWLLQDYAAAYCRSLAAMRIFRRCYWIDALGIGTTRSVPTATPPGAIAELNNHAASDEAGTGATEEPGNKRGRKKNGEQAIPPALQPIVNLSQQLQQESRPITLYGLIFEAGSSRRRKKRTTAQRVTLPRESALLPTSWLEAGSALLQELEHAPAIFLLNPFGAATFTCDDLAPLYQRTVPTELCLFVAHKQVETLLRSARRNAQNAAILTGLARSDRWKSLPLTEEDMRPAVDGWLDLFISAMQRHFLLPVQRIELALQAGRARIENVPYTLIFATRRQDSFASMNDAVYRYRQRLQEQSRYGVLAEDWFTAQEQERHREALQQLQQHILQQGRAQRIRRWPDLRQIALAASFGQFLLQDYDLLIRRLLLAGEVRCEWRQSPPAAEEERIPGNDDTLIWSTGSRQRYTHPLRRGR